MALPKGTYSRRGPLSPEIRAKISLALRGRRGTPNSPETRAKISAALNGGVRPANRLKWCLGCGIENLPFAAETCPQCSSPHLITYRRSDARVRH